MALKLSKYPIAPVYLTDGFIKHRK